MYWQTFKGNIMSQTFKQWLFNTYDRQELQEIAQHGCASGVSGGMIYYSETCDLYDKHAQELHGVVGQYEQETGVLPEYIIKYLGDLTGFKNAIVWFVAEYYAQEMTSEDMGV